MDKKDRIIKNINATMSMEGMELTEEDKKRLRRCLESKSTYQEVIDEIIEQYKK